MDYIDNVLDVEETTSKTKNVQNDENADGLCNFQVATNTLDASVKIYACRVDNVHNETYKVLGGLERSDKNTDDVEMITEIVDKNIESTEHLTKEKQKTRKRVCFITFYKRKIKLII